MDIIHTYLLICTVVIVISLIMLFIYKLMDDYSDYVESNGEYRIYLS